MQWLGFATSQGFNRMQFITEYHIPVTVALFGCILGAYVVGAWIARHKDAMRDSLGTIQGATLGLIGLLIGFCFSNAMTRFSERQDILVAEANSIGTVWLRADLLDSPFRQTVKEDVVAYARERLTLTESADDPRSRPILDRLDVIEARLWSAAIEGTRDRPQVGQMVLPALNEMFDLLSTRNAAARRHLPVISVLLVITTVVLGSLLLGYGRLAHPVTVRWAGLVVVLLMGALVWVTIDLDFPRHGSIQVTDAPLREVLRSMTETPRI